MTSRVSIEFKHEVVRVALTSGLGRRQIASDFDIGFSTLGCWIKEERMKILIDCFDNTSLRKPASNNILKKI